MARKTTTLETKFTGDDSGFNRVADRVERRGRRMGRTMAGIFGGIIGGVAGFATSTAIQRLEAGAEDSITAFDRLEKSIQPVAEVLGDAANYVMDLVDGFTELIGLGRIFGTGDTRIQGIGGVSSLALGGAGSMAAIVAAVQNEASNTGTAQTGMAPGVLGFMLNQQTAGAGGFGGLLSMQMMAMATAAGVSAPFLTGQRRFRQIDEQFEALTGFDPGSGLGASAAAVAASSPSFRLREQMLAEQTKTRVAVEENNRIIIENLGV